MLATLLLLAQLVLPWPGLDSPRVQPGPTICVGECAGPVVWGPAERGRLVVACDMTSDTCSDGRKITTQRATPVPCETSPGVWEMVPENTGCYSVRGLESWAANTSYLSWGAELDRSPWRPVRGGTVEKLPDGWRVKNDPNQDNSGVSQVLTGAASGEVWTSAYILRTSNDVPFLLWAGSSQACGGNFALNTGGAWRQFSCSTAVPSNPMAAIYPGSYVGSTPRPQYSVDVKAAWIVKSDTPGRPCWGGEAPVTCGADVHTISTDGWPTTEGEVSLVYTPGQAENASRFLISASTFGVEGWEFYVRNDDTMSFLVHNDGATIYSSAPLTWEPRPYALRVRWGDGIVSFWRDGILVGTRTMTRPPNGLTSTALIGYRGESGWVNGTISSLRIRSTP